MKESDPSRTPRFTYRDYVMTVMMKDGDFTPLTGHLRPFAAYFAGCTHVLDLGSGSGTFLGLLRERGIAASGVENDPELAEQLRGAGYDMVVGDAATVWGQTRLEFDGLFCSHLVEHLPFDQVVDMIAGIAEQIEAGGVVVFVFPNPESVEMQLFHFWRDPQHTRFYHADLLVGVLQHYGFAIVENYSRGLWRDLHAPPLPSPGIGLFQFLPFRARIRRWTLNWLGIPPLVVEAAYVRQLKAVGVEAVIVARRLRG